MPVEVLGFAAIPAWVIMLPLMFGAASFVAGPRLALSLGLLGSVATCALAIAIALAVWSAGPILHRVGGWGVPLGIELYADGLSVLMLLMTGVVGVATSVYAAGCFAGHGSDVDTGRRFWSLWLLMWGGLNALYLSTDIFNLYVALEVIGLAAVALVALGGRTAAVAAALRYLLVSLVGSFAYLLGVALLYAEYGALSFSGLTEVMVSAPASWLAAGCMAGGLALKTALYPLHFWLPPAHANALAPVSTLLSGLVVKASFYLLLRLWFGVFPVADQGGIAQLFGLLGAAAIVGGSLAAMAQQRLKLMVAYSTVAQIGYLFLLFPLISGPVVAATAYHGVVMHMLAHACAKAAMFMAAGNVFYALGHDRIAGIAAARRVLPVSMVAFALGGMSLIGLPPSGGFVAKWLLLTAALEGGVWWCAVIVVAGGVLAAGYVFRVVQQMFLQQVTDAAGVATPNLRVVWFMEFVPLLLAVLALLMGLVASPVFGLLETGVVVRAGR